MGLAKVWVRTFTDGLIRADRIIELSAHPAPALSGKTAHWLVDATLAVSIGSGTGEGLNISALHRTLIQTRAEPVGALEAFAQLLARLHDSDPAGVVTARVGDSAGADTAGHVEFTFTRFADAGDTTSAGDHVLG
ncbi:hypothetical protein [Amycolatopsis taiwanensis]|uniref:Uncharacterized protein n=1 Tax=Amycolatopsis taiwanensis TaxID=342230 RepID=A0A9W6R1C7_9PSEU|nr:hypothetical protein [Amycolatopsis taiwanensis]GLY66871.1 hypothetical protein Atai01_34900 [Amycolatopsis taiwanensis]